MRPRSQGCRVCVGRRIRCDLTRPFCLRCKTAGRVCDGYASRFVIEDPSTKGGVVAIRNKAATESSTLRDNELASGTVSASYLRLSQDMGLLDLNIALGTSPLRHHTEDAFCKFFLDQYFSTGTWNSEVQSNRQWIHEVLQSPSKNHVSLPALRCVIIGFFGHAQRDPNLKAEAAKSYSHAIVGLQRRLEIEQESRTLSRPYPSFQILSTTWLLLQYEYLAVTPPRGWIRHAGGLEALVRLYGPKYFERPGTRQRALLRIAKLSLQVESLRAYKRCFLDLDEWRTIWTDDEETREYHDLDSDGYRDIGSGPQVPNDDITDITAGLSAVFEDGQRLKHMILGGESVQNELSRITTLQDSLTKIKNDLDGWWERHSSDGTKVPVAVTDETPNPSTISTLSGNFTSFSSLTAAHNVCRYHAHNILILMWMNRVQSLLLRDGNSNDANASNSTLSAMKPFPPIATPAEYGSTAHPNVIQLFYHARAICDALPMYLLPQYRYLGGLWASFPARVAWQVFPTSSKQGLWLERFLDKVADISGFEFNRYICRPL